VYNYERPGWVYIERDEIFSKGIPHHLFENTPGSEYDYVKRGYWIKQGSAITGLLQEYRPRVLNNYVHAKF